MSGTAGTRTGKLKIRKSRVFLSLTVKQSSIFISEQCERRMRHIPNYKLVGE
jgi:hypothetical protein